MAQPFVGQILTVAFNFAPVGWMTCDGQLLPISEFETLFNLIGTTFGGDGQTDFALPDLRGRVVVGTGSNGMSGYTLAETGGVETVTLTTPQIPVHGHLVQTAATGNTADPGPGVVLGTPSGLTGTYAAPGATTALASGSIGASGASQPHDNHQPFLTLNYIISLFGIFPSQT